MSPAEKRAQTWHDHQRTKASLAKANMHRVFPCWCCCVACADQNPHYDAASYAQQETDSLP